MLQASQSIAKVSAPKVSKRFGALYLQLFYMPKFAKSVKPFSPFLV